MPCLKHKWKGCRCEKCGRTRDKEHDYQPVEGACLQKCSLCGHLVEVHPWVADSCPQCGMKNGPLDKNAYLIILRKQESPVGKDSPCTVLINNELVGGLYSNSSYYAEVTVRQCTCLLSVSEFPRASYAIHLRPGEIVLAEIVFRGFAGVEIRVTHHLSRKQVAQMHLCPDLHCLRDQDK